jgi:hypothetical protein
VAEATTLEPLALGQTTALDYSTTNPSTKTKSTSEKEKDNNAQTRTSKETYNGTW